MMTLMSRINQDLLVRFTTTFLKFLGLTLIAMALVNTVNAKFDHLKEGSEAYRRGFVSAADRTKQLDCLTKNIYWEAATEPFEGKVAVAQVTMNRVDNGRFGNDVCGVVYRKDNILGRVICQFSWACENTHKIRPVYPALYKESEEVAKKVLLENFRLSTMTNALYYHADYVNPKWGKPKVGQIGRHIFYRD
jgi:spore germination cell wall hydrolase CwlJ-like protein